MGARQIKCMGQKDVEDLYAKRIKICRGCPHLESGFLKTDTCGLCGCKLPLKARMSDAECPLGKWKQ